MAWPSPTPHVRRPRGAPCRGRPGLFRWICVFVGSGFEPSHIPSDFSLTAQCAGAAVSGLHHGHRGGCPCASVAQGVVCQMLVQQSGLRIAVCGSCSVFGLRWWAGVCCVCVPLMVSCSGFGLPLHAQLLRLFVTKLVYAFLTIASLCNNTRGA